MLKLVLEGLDLPLVLETKLLELPLLSQGEHLLVVDILCGLTSTLDMLWVETSIPAVETELGGVQPSDFEHHHELFGSTPAIGFLLGCQHHFFLQPPGLLPVVKGDDVDAQL